MKLNELNKYTHKVQNNQFSVDTTQTTAVEYIYFIIELLLGFFFLLFKLVIYTYNKFALYCAISFYLLFCADATGRAVLCYRGLPAWRSSIKYLQVMEIKVFIIVIHITNCKILITCCTKPLMKFFLLIFKTSFIVFK